ncbi:flagellar protein FlgN [Vibrio sp. J1-1]|uniref:flagellar protein FlgN n=1 Tax=Vibrio sp. J1-1 TaxID=2912251 RepID=UPI001F4058A8|nr:flagellar protein FlgN [Vibrio sp. J1-1]MCF7480422.1 flagellar protein FlgN [Vibrio sp. J1-1]
MASEKQLLIQEFIQSISQDVKLYQKLMELQQKQSGLYLTFDASALRANVDQQIPILGQLNRNAAKRSHCMQKLGLPANEKGVSKIFSVLPEKLSLPLKQQWCQLEALIIECQQYNQKNGQSSASFHELMSQFTHASPDTYEDQLV